MIKKIMHFIVIFLCIFQNIYSNSCRKEGILGVGQAMVDYCVQLPEATLIKYLKKLNIKKKGEGCCIKQKQKNYLLKSFNDETINKTICSGGSTANTIAGISYLGEKASFAGVLGKDVLGNIFIDDIKKYGTTVMCDTFSGNTGVVFSLISDLDGERSMAAYPGISLKYFNKHSFLNKSALSSYKIIFSDGYMFLSKKSKQFLFSLFKKIKKKRGITAFSIAALHVVSSFKKDLNTLLKYVDILFGNEEEFKQLFGVDSIIKAFPLIAKKVDIGVITMREKGAYIIQKNKVILSKTKKINHVIDATGAGDMFAAGFLYGHLQGYDTKKAGMIGNKLASQVIQKIGAKP
jgi:sugar/nucleoside kinase (ribokinase family)